MPRINIDEFTAFPKNLFVAVLAEGETPESVSEALLGAGFPEERFDFLQGEEGLRILNPDGKHGTVKERMLRKAENFSAEGRIVEAAAGYLRAGRTMLGVHDVDEHEAERLKYASEGLGLEDCHYLGRWKID